MHVHVWPNHHAPTFRDKAVHQPVLVFMKEMPVHTGHAALLQFRVASTKVSNCLLLELYMHATLYVRMYIRTIGGN